MAIKYQSYYNRLKKLRAVVVIPTYNNCQTLESVIDSVLEYTNDIIVVNDGSTDSTSTILQKYINKLEIISYEQNRGKGHALKLSFKKALKMSFDYAITIDSDGQHYASDLSTFIETLENSPNSLVIGSRLLEQNNMAKSSTFANRFSNFWYTVQTLKSLPDTQSGYRAYPLAKMGKMKIWTNRYETELEIIVFSAWRRIKISPVPISVYYAPPEEKISHFNPLRDFTRISILNTFLMIIAIIYGYPSMLIRYLINALVPNKK